MQQLSLKNKTVLLWVIGITCFKLVLFSVYALAFNKNWNKDQLVMAIAVITADTQDYYQPVERALNGEGYAMALATETDPPIAEVRPWSRRMPGLLPVYGPLYLLFGSAGGKFAVIILQLIAEIFSVILLSRAAARLFNKMAVFYLCLILYACNSFVSVYTLYTTSESFCISFFIFSFYFMLRFADSKRNSDLFMAGLFLTWSIFFRTVIIMFVPFYVIGLLYICYKNDLFRFKTVFVKLLVLFSVFMFCDALWVYRNFKTMHRFIPLHGGENEIITQQESALYDLIIAWGGDIASWNPSEGRWFMRPMISKTRVNDPEFQKTNPFPAYIFTPEYNLDSLRQLRAIYWKSFDYRFPDSAALYKKEFISTSQKFLLSFKKNKPFRYYVLSKLNHFKTFILIKRPYALPFISSNILNKGLRVLSLLFYYCVLLLAAAGVWFTWREKNLVLARLFFSGAALFILVHVCFGFTEFRYILPAYPIITVFAAFGAFKLMVFLKSRQLLPGTISDDELKTINPTS